MPCVAIQSACVGLGLIPAGQAGRNCLAASGPVWCRLIRLSLGYSLACGTMQCDWASQNKLTE